VTIEKRLHKRAPMVAPVDAETGGKNYHVESRNISVGGLLVRAEMTFPEHTPLLVRFTLPGTGHEVVTAAVVQHASPDAFMGIRFEGLPAAAHDAIEKYVEAQAAKGGPSKRILKRVPFVAKIEAQAGGFPFIAIAEDISEGGVRVKTANPLAEDSVVHLKFTLPNSEKEINVSGVVRHVNPGSGMGVQFADLEGATLEVIRQYVSAG
jgi:uncharacterized protein (TIGR02266 family)